MPPMPPRAAEIDAQTSLGELRIASLIRAQWRLSVSVLALAAVLIGGLPLLFLFVPSTRTVSIGPIPLPWLILGVLIYPAVWVTARYYVRQSAQIEREFTELDAQR